MRQVREELADGVPPGVVLMDPAYGNDSKLRAGIGELVLTYMAGILPGTIVWRPGETPLPQHPSDFAICPMAGASGHDDARRSAPAPKEWLSVEWPEGAAEPDHYWLSTLPADITLERMVDQAKMLWRIERDYPELKQEVGLGHYEGRGWRGLTAFSQWFVPQ